ncbi:MAG: ShlB/FhaC/HecB family hemolysin secretion/activation protein [Sedimentisphaerales bacterium]|nr:ShlB/FhaC/HecB family hemolysin secretion/activation protein [Sedimentisphaerales bacterium]
MRRAKQLVELAIVITLFCLPYLSAREKPAPQFEGQRSAEEADKREQAEAQKAKKEEQKQQTQIELAKSRLPADTTPKLKVREIRFNGNTLVSTSELLADMPVVFNASDKPLNKAESQYLYDFTFLQEVIAAPGIARDVSARTIQGLTQYVLSVYQQKNYGGIYVYVPAGVLKGAELKDGILLVDIIEARISSVGLKYYDVNQAVAEKGYLDANTMLSWSPVRQGRVMNRKKLDDFVNLLNLNPDRYVSPVVGKGDEPNTLVVNYGIYEANPWHYFIQVDNSGVKERRWSPIVGVINTNLLGYDDSFFATYQSPWDSGIEDNYALFGSYDIPINGPKLRLNIYGGYSEFDISPEATEAQFIGGGKFIGANLKYNVLQSNGWFFDIIGTVSEEISKNTSFFDDLEITSSSVRMHLWGAGIDVHKRDDVSNAALGYKLTASMGGSEQEEFTRSRPPTPPDGLGAEKDFAFHNLYGSYSRLLDTNKVTRLSTTLKWILTSDRLPPNKMTPFGGFYSVRGYDEYEIVGDGGVLASAQYEFDLIRYEKLKSASRQEVDKEQRKEKGLKKVAPLVFSDFGRSTINHPAGTEESHETLFSIGVGTLVEYGDNFSGGVYYGYPLKETEETRRGKGRVNVSFMLRW